MTLELSQPIWDLLPFYQRLIFLFIEKFADVKSLFQGCVHAAENTQGVQFLAMWGICEGKNCCILGTHHMVVLHFNSTAGTQPPLLAPTPSPTPNIFVCSRCYAYHRVSNCFCIFFLCFYIFCGWSDWIHKNILSIQGRLDNNEYVRAIRLKIKFCRCPLHSSMECVYRVGLSEL